MKHYIIVSGDEQKSSDGRQTNIEFLLNEAAKKGYSVVCETGNHWGPSFLMVRESTPLPIR